MLTFANSLKLKPLKSCAKIPQKSNRIQKNYPIRSLRFYSQETSNALTKTEISARVVNAIKQSNLVGVEVLPTSHFYKDLGLDSLEKTEVVVLLENEFMIEIPDVDVNNIHSCQDAIQYLSGLPYVK